MDTPNPSTTHHHANRTPAYTFPTTLPTTTLSAEGKKEGYGFTKDNCPDTLEDDMANFRKFSTEAYNFNRTGKYMQAVDLVTVDKQETLIRGYAGFCHLYFKVSTMDIGLDSYKDPTKVAHFLSYLQARDVHKGHAIRHVSLARKVNMFLASDASQGSAEAAHANKMDAWLQTVEAQLNANMDRPVTQDRPDASKVYAWAQAVAKQAVGAHAEDILAQAKLLGRLSLQGQGARPSIPSPEPRFLKPYCSADWSFQTAECFASSAYPNPPSWDPGTRPSGPVPPPIT